MEKKYTGIVVSVKPYGADFMITLITAEEGLVNVLVENKPNFFKFAKELLTFGYFTVKVKGGFFCILLKCEIIDTFLKIKNSNLKFLEAKNLCGVVKEVAQLNDKDTPLFMEFCESLKALNYKDLPPNLVLTKLLSTIFVGFSKSISFQTCDVCGQSLKNFYFLNFANCTFVCQNCQEKLSKPISKQTFGTLKRFIETHYDDIENLINFDNKKILQLLIEIFRFKVGERFKFYSE